MQNYRDTLLPGPPRVRARLYGVPRPRRAPTTLDAERLLSLDAFRGVTIAAMILVNNPGTWEHTYGPLRHAPWNGWTTADLIFPFFLFIVGVAITFSFNDKLGHARRGRFLVSKVVRRALIIFILGIILNGFPLFDWSTLRIPGVLQRVALCYCLAAMAAVMMGIRGQALTAAILVIAYWAVMQLVPVSGHPAGSFGPDTSLAAYIDAALLPNHLLHAGWDPEGILGTFPALATTLCGVLTGHWLRSSRSASARVAGLFVAGNIGLVLGLVMDIWLPINKSLWSSSYVVFTAGMALDILAMCYWLVDFRGYRRWAKPFIVFGTNPIVAYVLSSLMAKVMLLGKVTLADGSKIDFQRYVFEHFFLPLARPVDASLLYALAYVFLWLGITAFLYRKRIIIKI
ncbi:MAG: acyltransferase family protein [Candidatus Binatia bacterium]